MTTITTTTPLALKEEIRNEDGTVTLVLVSGESLTFTPDPKRPILKAMWLDRLRTRSAKK